MVSRAKEAVLRLKSEVKLFASPPANHMTRFSKPIPTDSCGTREETRRLRELNNTEGRLTDRRVGMRRDYQV